MSRNFLKGFSLSTLATTLILQATPAMSAPAVFPPKRQAQPPIAFVYTKKLEQSVQLREVLPALQALNAAYRQIDIPELTHGPRSFANRFGLAGAMVATGKSADLVKATFNEIKQQSEQSQPHLDLSDTVLTHLTVAALVSGASSEKVLETKIFFAERLLNVRQTSPELEAALVNVVFTTNKSPTAVLERFDEIVLNDQDYLGLTKWNLESIAAMTAASLIAEVSPADVLAEFLKTRRLTDNYNFSGVLHEAGVVQLAFAKVISDASNDEVTSVMTELKEIKKQNSVQWEDSAFTMAGGMSMLSSQNNSESTAQ